MREREIEMIEIINRKSSFCNNFSLNYYSLNTTKFCHLKKQIVLIEKKGSTELTNKCNRFDGIKFAD